MSGGLGDFVADLSDTAAAKATRAEAEAATAVVARRVQANKDAKAAAESNAASMKALSAAKSGSGNYGGAIARTEDPMNGTPAEMDAQCKAVPGHYDKLQAESTRRQNILNAADEESSGGAATGPKAEAQSGRGDPPEQDPANPNETATARDARFADYIITKLGETSTATKLLIAGGIGAAAWAIHLTAMRDATNSSVVIKTISIEQVSGSPTKRNVTITYDRSKDIIRRSPPGNIPIKSYFNPSRGDAVTCTSTPFTSSDEFRVIEAGPNSVNIRCTLGKLQGFIDLDTAVDSTNSVYNPTATSYTWTATSDSSRMEVYSNFGNQLADDADAGMNLLSLLLETLFANMANALSNLAAAGGGAASAAFCTVAPLLCDSVLWIVIGIGALFFLVVMAFK